MTILLQHGSGIMTEIIPKESKLLGEYHDFEIYMVYVTHGDTYVQRFFTDYDEAFAAAVEILTAYKDVEEDGPVVKINIGPINIPTYIDTSKIDAYLGYERVYITPEVTSISMRNG